MKKILFPIIGILLILSISPFFLHKEKEVEIKAAEDISVLNETKIEDVAIENKEGPDENTYVHNLEKEAELEKTLLIDKNEMNEYYELLRAKEGRQIFSKTIKEEPVTAYTSNVAGNGAVAVDWWDLGRYMYKVGTVAKVTDVESGKTFNIIRTGGINHADNEPLELEDTQVMKDIVKTWDWYIRPVILEFDGNRIAASMYWMPHGYQTRESNGFEGHFCIHFVNSTHHYSGKINEKHQSTILLAEGK